MNRFSQTITLLGLTISSAIAAQPGPACAPVLSAMAKTLQVDHATASQSEGHTTNGITAAGVNYLQINNVWKVSPLSPKDNQQRSDENLHDAKSFVCQALPDSSIDGVPVANYKLRTEAEDAVVDSKISISKASGLAVAVEYDIDPGGGDKKSHISTRYSYTGIHAPAVQK